jgi:GntR family transcriptional regulator
VSVITVKRAYLELEREGLILTQHGKGSIIASDPDVALDLNRRELQECLEQSLRLGAQLGLDAEDLADRLNEMEVRMNIRSAEKENA